MFARKYHYSRKGDGGIENSNILDCGIISVPKEGGYIPKPSSYNKYKNLRFLPALKNAVMKDGDNLHSGTWFMEFTGVGDSYFVRIIINYWGKGRNGTYY